MDHTGRFFDIGGIFKLYICIISSLKSNLTLTHFILYDPNFIADTSKRKTQEKSLYIEKYDNVFYICAKMYFTLDFLINIKKSETYIRSNAISIVYCVILVISINDYIVITINILMRIVNTII